MGEPDAVDKYARYSRDLKRGLPYEDFVYTLLQRQLGITVVSYHSSEWQNKIGENSGGIEIKFNEKYDETGNLWIETHRKSHPEQPEYKLSGILRPDNGWLFVTGTYAIVYVFSRRMLQGVRSQYKEKVISTSKGFLLPKRDAEKYAAKVLFPDDTAIRQALEASSQPQPTP